MKHSIIEWIDAEDWSGTWASKEEAEKFAREECLVISVGYIVKKTKKYLTIAGDLIQEKDGPTYGRLTKIPIGFIRSIK